MLQPGWGQDNYKGERRLPVASSLAQPQMASSALKSGL